jgi:hypothetical protein
MAVQPSRTLAPTSGSLKVVGGRFEVGVVVQEAVFILQFAWRSLLRVGQSVAPKSAKYNAG